MIMIKKIIFFDAKTERERKRRECDGKAEWKERIEIRVGRKKRIGQKKSQ